MQANYPKSLTSSFLEHYTDLMHFLTRRLGCQENAADVAQDTYLRLAGIEHQTGEIADQRAYIFRVAGNIAIDTLRRNGRLAERHSVGELQTLIDDKPSQESCVHGTERLQRLDELLSELPDKARLALLHNRIDGLTHAEIAARLDVSESMVAKYLAQALRHCRDGLQALDSP